MEHAARLLVIRVGREHRADDAELIGDRRQVRQQLAHLDAGFAVLRERELGRHQPGRRPLGAQVGRRRPLARVFHQRGLRIPQVNLRRPAGHEQQDDVLRFRREVRADDVRAGRERVIGEQIGEAEHADAAAHALQRFAPREFFYGQKITSLVESSACA